MNKQLKKLTCQRNGFRLNVNNEIIKFDQKSNQTPETISNEIDSIKIIGEKLREYQTKIVALDSLILDEIEEDDAMENEAADAALFFDKMLETIKSIDILTTNHNHAIQQNTDHNSDHHTIHSEHNSRQSSHTFNRQSTNAHLPKIEIKPFHGGALQWQSFWDIFETTIHTRDNLQPVEKLTYLRSYLRSEALQVIEGFRLTSSNYDVVVDTLKERYGNPEFAIYAHFEQLLALPSGQHEYTQIQRIYDECEKHIRSLVALGLSEDTFGKVFTPIILSKLPPAIRIQLHRQNGSKPWQLSTLRTLMREEIQARQMSDRFSGQKADTKSPSSNHYSNDSQSYQKSPNQGNQRQFNKPNSYPSGSPKQFNNRPPSSQSTLSNSTKAGVVCSYCNGTHFADKCSKYSTADQRKSMLNGRCIKCLGSGHTSKECHKTNSCFYCKRDNHHSSLCYSQFGNKSNVQSQSSRPATSPSSNTASFRPNGQRSTTTSHNMMQTSRKVQMHMALVSFPQNNVTARVFLDSGSSRSYITKRLSSTLDITPDGNETIISSKFGDRRCKAESFDTADVSIPTRDGPVDVSFLITDHISCPLPKYPVDASRNPILRCVPLADFPVEQTEEVCIDILIGEDYFYDFIGSERITLDNGMYLVQSKFGYIVTGRVPSDNSDSSPNIAVNCLRPVCTIPFTQFEKFCSLEDIGIKDNPYNTDDENALQQFNDSIRFCPKENRYEVKFPMRSDAEFPTNRGLAEGSLTSLIRRFGKQPDVMNEYNKTIQDQLSKGVIEEVDNRPTTNKIHYIPHHPVIRKDKSTTKLRIVYNASAKCGKDKPSLNECLLRGPIMMQDLCGILIRFRLPNVAISSDVEKAFLQVGLQESDRDITRFLWLRDIHKPVSRDNIVILRFRRVPFGFIPSPFLLQGVIMHHLNSVGSDIAKNILKSVYVDNVISGTEDIDTARKYYSEAKRLFSSISMNIREWYSNSKEFQNSIPAVDHGKDDIPKVLGLAWDTKKDELSCPGFKDLTSEKVTKRTLLQSISTLYDPCGFFAPIVIRGKILIQDVWKEKFDWDDKLPNEYAERYKELVDEFNNISTIKIPRIVQHFSSHLNVINELHCFSDASSKAYATAIYLRSSIASGATSNNLLFAKARLSPMKMISLPRLELMGVLIATRAASFILKEIGLPINRVVVWTDAKCVLYWIHSSKVLTVFVHNRIKEIKSHPSFQYRYVPTAVNPADIPTRGANSDEFQQMDSWWKGPEFLSQPEAMWPKNEFDNATDNTESEEVQSISLAQITVDPPSISKSINMDNYSGLSRLLRVTAWVYRFMSNCRKESKSLTNTLTSTELSAAETAWIKSVQLQLLDHTPTNKQLFRQLNVFQDDDGILRCAGRLQNSDLPINSKHPILIPKNTTFTKLLIISIHEKEFHAGVRQTLSQLRCNYWIPHGMSQVQFVVRKCLVCRKAEGGPFKVPEMPSLPDYRVKRCPPFSHVGIDYLGPILVKNCSNDEITKVWVCLFTCAVTRAVHLEVVIDNTTEQFIMCLRRFSALHGTPQMIISDNAKTFTSANSIIDNISKREAVQDFVSTQRIEWKFIPAVAPWMGGFYERLVGSVKRSLRKALGSKCLDLIQLQTIMAEVAAIVNSRPLVPTNLDVGELALTPSHFLGKGNRTNLPGPIINSDDPPFDQSKRFEILLQNWTKGQHLLDEFWRSWHKEYLSSLRDRPFKNLNERNAIDIPVKPGIVVLIKEHLPRSHWRMGKIVATHVGSDGRIRSASVQTANGRKICRPIKLLCPIEDSAADSTEYPEVTSIPTATPRHRRRAAVKASDAIRQQLVDSDGDDSDM